MVEPATNDCVRCVGSATAMLKKGQDRSLLASPSREPGLESDPHAVRTGIRTALTKLNESGFTGSARPVVLTEPETSPTRATRGRLQAKAEEWQTRRGASDRNRTDRICRRRRNERHHGNGDRGVLEPLLVKERPASRLVVRLRHRSHGAVVMNRRGGRMHLRRQKNRDVARRERRRERQHDEHGQQPRIHGGEDATTHDVGRLTRDVPDIGAQELLIFFGMTGGRAWRSHKSANDRSSFLHRCQTLTIEMPAPASAVPCGAAARYPRGPSA